jgi:HEAT repeat protein
MQRHLENLGHPDAEACLVRYYKGRALEGLVAACSHPDHKVCFRAVWALGKIGDRRAFDTILRLCGDEHGHVRYDAAMALGDLGDERARPFLWELVMRDDQEDCTGSAALMALRRTAPPLSRGREKELERFAEWRWALWRSSPM